MKIVVLAGGTSTEREISIVSGTGICGALRQKGHEAILVDIFCGVENVDWENPFPAEYDCYCSLVTFREAFFVNKVHRKPENCGAKSCECMISVHREARYCERSEQ